MDINIEIYRMMPSFIEYLIPAPTPDIMNAKEGLEEISNNNLYSSWLIMLLLYSRDVNRAPSGNPPMLPTIKGIIPIGLIVNMYLNILEIFDEVFIDKLQIR